MKAKNCPRCESDDLDINDCGYSSFNIAWVRCKQCNLTVKVTGDNAVNTWNKWIEDPAGTLVEEIRYKAKENRRLRKETGIDISEYAADLISVLSTKKTPKTKKSNMISREEAESFLYKVDVEGLCYAIRNYAPENTNDEDLERTLAAFKIIYGKIKEYVEELRDHYGIEEC